MHGWNNNLTGWYKQIPFFSKYTVVYAYDQIENFSQHGIIASEQLKNKLPDEAIHAIQSHDYRTEVKPVSILDKALIFADSLAIFIESKAELNTEQYIFKEKPWLWNNLVKFSQDHELNIFEIVGQLAI